MERRASPPWAALLLVTSLALPLALSGPTSPRALQAAQPGPPGGGCFGYNRVNDSYIPRTVSALRIALIEPILTSTPYSQYDTGSFYAFYAMEAGVTSEVRTNLNLLSTNVSSGYGFNHGWGLSAGMYLFFTSQTASSCGLVIGKNVQVLTDMEVADGALFNAGNHTNRFDAVVLPFTEYVEASEYVAYEDFVAEGGTLVMMGHSLEYPVSYNATTQMETLVYAHNWAFNGTYATHIACGSSSYVASCPWAGNNTEWTGSNTCEASCFHTYAYNGSVVEPDNPIGSALYREFGGTVFESYAAHEENSVTNMTGTALVSVFVNDSRNLIASYTHQFRKGAVVCFGVFGDDIIATDPSAQYFLLQGLVYGRTVPSPAGSTTQYSSETTATSHGGALTISSTASSSSSSRASALPWTPLAAGALVTTAVVVGALTARRRHKPRG